MHKSLGQLMAIINEFRKLDPEMQAQQMLVFVTVAANPDITMRELEDKVALSSSTISRNIAALSATHRKGHSGHDLVRAYEDPNDRRYKRVQLTPKGRLVAESVAGLIDNSDMKP